MNLATALARTSNNKLIREEDLNEPFLRRIGSRDGYFLKGQDVLFMHLCFFKFLMASCSSMILFTSSEVFSIILLYTFQRRFRPCKCLHTAKNI